MKAVAPHILAINDGSSSIRFALYQAGGDLKRRLYGKIDRIGLGGTNLTFTDSTGKAQESLAVETGNHKSAANFLISWLEEQISFKTVQAVGHRVVHGMTHSQPEQVTPELLGELHRIIAVNQVLTSALRLGFNETSLGERPNGNDYGIPSGHVAFVMSGAAFLHKRYGWKWGAPAYLAGAYVAYARVEDDHHHWRRDVIASTVLAYGVAMLTVTPENATYRHRLSGPIFSVCAGVSPFDNPTPPNSGVMQCNMQGRS